MNLDLLALSLSKSLTPRLKHILLSEYKSLSREVLTGEKLNSFLRSEKRPQFEGWPALYDAADKVIKACREKDIRIITCGDDRYPARLKHIYSPPLALYVLGPLDSDFFNTCSDTSRKTNVAVVGTRRPAGFALDFTRAFSSLACSLGFQVISGLAMGVDAAAHENAYPSGLTTAVLGCGVDVIYPYRNRALYRCLLKHNCNIISEYPPSTQPLRYHFPARNRIISALSDYILMVQAGERSGALITVNYGLEQNKEILVFKGPAQHESFLGNTRLAEEGAAPLAVPGDFLRYLGLTPAEEKPGLSGTVSLKEKIYRVMSGVPRSLADLAGELLVSEHELSGCLAEMICLGEVCEAPGMKYFKPYQITQTG